MGGYGSVADPLGDLEVGGIAGADGREMIIDNFLNVLVPLLPLD